MSDDLLDGVRVLDLSRLLPGPYATQILADHGADVIKIEEPQLGDYARYMEPYVDGVGLIFGAVNRGKRAMTLDLTAEAGREVLYALVETADVLVEGFSPGTVGSMEIDYETLSGINDQLVYCSLSGYGQTGPYRDRPGHDLNYEGYTGFLDMTRSDPGDKPSVPGFPVADMAGGLTAVQEIVTALLGRELGNSSGRYLDVSIAEAMLSFSQVVSSEALAGNEPRPGETLLTGKYPCYGIYEAADGKYVTLSALEPKFWSRFCRLVDREDLEDLHLSDDPAERRELREALTTLFKQRNRDDWEESLGDEGVMVGSVLEPREAVDNVHFRDRGDVLPEEGRISLRGAASGKKDWPEKGEHNREILSTLGYDDQTIEEYRANSVI